MIWPLNKIVTWWKIYPTSELYAIVHQNCCEIKMCEKSIFDQYKMSI